MPNGNEEWYLGDLRQRMTQAKTAVLRARPPIDETWNRGKDKGPEQTDDEATVGPPEMPLDKRFEGMWMVGRQGSGKTQFFKQLAARDLDVVAAGEASMIVLDPVGCHPAVHRRDKHGDERRVSPSTLVHTITRLRRFYRGGDLYGRLILHRPDKSKLYRPYKPFLASA